MSSSASANMAEAFFSGSLRDNTTKESFKKAAKKPTTQHKKGNSAPSNSLQAEVQADLHRRIHALGKSGKIFEENAAYQHDVKLAGDAEYLVQGMDPQAARSYERFASSRKIHVQRKHWVAFKTGYCFTPYGVAYIHSDGSVVMLQHGKPLQCHCGALHMP